jgi:predicted Zn-dependent peptidase
LDEWFTTDELPNGIDLHVMQTSKFKSNAITAVFYSDLTEDTVTPNAILPEVLTRGTRRWPRTAELMQNLDSLYGTGLSAVVGKMGEKHLLIFSVDVANDAYLSANEDLLSEGFAILRDVVFDPVLEGGAFRQDYVEQEKTNLRRRIESIIDNKLAYAFRRCNEEMFRGEPYAMHRLGRVEDIDGIGPESLRLWHRQAVTQLPLDIFVVGDVAREHVLELVGEVFDMKRDPMPFEVPAGAQHRVPAQPRSVVETMDVNQGNLVMGYSTGINIADLDYPALLMANGIYGAYTHSKLFQNVREGESLAYSVYSGIDQNKGVMHVWAGIAPDAMDRAVEIIEAQLDDVRSGRISDDEVEKTRRAISRDIRMMGDSPVAQIDYAIVSRINGVQETPDELLRRIESVSLDDVVRAANRIQLDTIYFLRDEEDNVGA